LALESEGGGAQGVAAAEARAHEGQGRLLGQRPPGWGMGAGPRFHGAGGWVAPGVGWRQAGPRSPIGRTFNPRIERQCHAAEEAHNGRE